MKFRARNSLRAISLLCLIAVFAGCASTEVTQQTATVNEAISRPNRIWVYDFTLGDVAPDSTIPDRVSAEANPPAAGQFESYHRLGAVIASDLVADIQEMGLSAVQAGPGSSPQVGDGEIRGHLVSVEDGAFAERFIIGFGAGRSEMDTVAEDYLITGRGRRKLGSWKLSSSGSRTPGIITSAAMAIVTANPIHFAIAGGMKLYGEVSGRSKLDGRAKATADALANELRITFQDRGWMS